MSFVGTHRDALSFGTGGHFDALPHMAFVNPQPLSLVTPHPDELGPDVRATMPTPKALREQAVRLMRLAASAPRRLRRDLLTSVSQILAALRYRQCLSRYSWPVINIAPLGARLAATPAAPHAPPAATVAPHETWTLAVAVG